MLEGIDLELAPGSRTVIVGGNGSGKSTLLRIGAGVSRPTSGSVELPDRIGYVPERLAARTRFTGAEYLVNMGRIKGLSSEVIRTRSRELLGRLDLRPGPDARIESLSKGNRQKLVLAQAFLGRVDLLVLDEPFNGLDPVALAALSELTKEAQSDGTAVLVSSHGTLPQQVGLRQLGIQGGQLDELRHDEAAAFPGAGDMLVELFPTDSPSDLEEIADLPGVSHALFDHRQGRLVLRTDSLQIDAVLVEAIARGWSVRSVRQAGESDPE